MNRYAISTLAALRAVGLSAPLELLFYTPTPQRAVKLDTSAYISFAIDVGVCAVDPALGRTLYVMNAGEQESCKGRPLVESFILRANQAAAFGDNAIILLQSPHLARNGQMYDGSSVEHLSLHSVSLLTTNTKWKALKPKDWRRFRKFANLHRPFLAAFDEHHWCTAATSGCYETRDVLLTIFLSALAFLVVLEHRQAPLTSMVTTMLSAKAAWMAREPSKAHRKQKKKKAARPMERDAAPVCPMAKSMEEVAARACTDDGADEFFDCAMEPQDAEDAEEYGAAAAADRRACEEQAATGGDVVVESDASVLVATFGDISRSRSPNSAATASDTVSIIESVSSDEDRLQRDAPRLHVQMLKGAAIIQQVQYYFDHQNLYRDKFLLSCMDSHGWVDVGVIMRFNRMLALHAAEFDVLELLRDSIVVEVDEARRLVRSRLWHTLNIPCSTAPASGGAMAKSI